MGSVRHARLGSWSSAESPLPGGSGSRTRLGLSHLSSSATPDVQPWLARRAPLRVGVRGEFGGVLACMLGGFVVFKAGGALPVDWMGKTVLNGAAFAWLVSIQRAVRRREV
jgi:hypothetical protein